MFSFFMQLSPKTMEHLLREQKTNSLIYQKMANKQKIGNRHMNTPQNVKLFEHLQDVHQCVSKTITIFKTNFKMMDGCFV